MKSSVLHRECPLIWFFFSGTTHRSESKSLKLHVESVDGTTTTCHSRFPTVDLGRMVYDVLRGFMSLEPNHDQGYVHTHLYCRCDQSHSRLDPVESEVLKYARTP